MSQSSDTDTERVAIVTGGGSSIGPAVGAHLARAGHAVALLDHQGEAVRTAADELTKAGARTIGIEVDVTQRDSVYSAVDRVRDELGPVTIVVTSAGIDVGIPVPVTDITPEQWNRLIAVKLTGTFTSIQAAVPDMQAAGWGRIVTISSSSAQSGALRTRPLRGLERWGHRLDQGVGIRTSAPGITVNTIPPSIVDTPMAPNGVAVGTVPELTS